MSHAVDVKSEGTYKSLGDKGDGKAAAPAAGAAAAAPAPAAPESFAAKWGTAIFAAVMVGTTIILMSTMIKKTSDAGLKPFDFAAQFNSSLAPSAAGVQWLNGLDCYTAVEGNAIVMYNLSDPNGPDEGTRTVLVPAAWAVDPLTNGTLTIGSYTFSVDLQYVLIPTRHHKKYRHSSTDVYVVLDTKSTAARKTSVLAGGFPLQYAEFDPVGHVIAYVFANNLYTHNLATGQTHAVTTDGLNNDVINGVCDWAYEEEVFQRTSAIWWSPDGRHLGFLRFLERAVPEYEFPLYQIPYNQEYVYKYPKAGFTNSNVTLGIHNMLTRTTQWAKFDDPSKYIIELAWFGEATLAARVMPRIQNTWTLYAVSAADGSIRALSSAHHPQYLEPHTALTYFPALDQYVDQVVVGDNDHLVLFDAKTGAAVRNLTYSDSWGVDAVYGVQLSTNIIFFTSTQISSIERALYSVTNMGVVTRLVNRAAGLRTWQSASFSASGNYFVLNERADQPSSSLRYIGTPDQVQFMLEDNLYVMQALSAYALPTREFLTIPGLVPGTNLNAYFLYPPGFSKTAGIKYPVLINVYGGPGNQQVTSVFGVGARGPGFHTYLASSQGFIVFVVDPIGTGGQGDRFQKATTYKNLGVNEAKDCVNAVKWLQTLPYVDSTRIAHWGWSFGGFLASMINGEGAGVLKSIIAVAPVADWRLYDSIYTERYMQRPIDNPLGYNTSSVLSRVASFDTQYMLIHGTGDDNVHFQNGAVIANALVQNGIQFSTMFYPNRDHSLTGPHQEPNQHLYKMLTNHLLLTLDISSPASASS